MRLVLLAELSGRSGRPLKACLDLHAEVGSSKTTSPERLRTSREILLAWELLKEKGRAEPEGLTLACPSGHDHSAPGRPVGCEEKARNKAVHQRGDPHTGTGGWTGPWIAEKVRGAGAELGLKPAFPYPIALGPPARL